jgi:hypothetical protein
VKQADSNILRVALHSSGQIITLNRSEGDGANEGAVWEFTDNAKVDDPYNAIFKSGQRAQRAAPALTTADSGYNRRILDQPNYGVPTPGYPYAHGGGGYGPMMYGQASSPYSVQGEGYGQPTYGSYTGGAGMSPGASSSPYQN